MLEMKITITAPDLAVAINNLAEAYAKNNSNPLEKTAKALKGVAENTKTVAANPPQVAQVPQTTAAPVTIAPIANPVPTAPTNPTPAPGVPSSVTPAQTAAPATDPAPVPTAAPQYTLEMIATAGSSLIDAGKLDQLMALLGRHGVDSLTNLKPEEYGAVATELRALGARL